MAMSEKAIQGRRAYYRDLYRKKMSTKKGRDATEKSKERYWEKMADKYAADQPSTEAGGGGK